jgi:hypothetical protein
MMKSSTEAGGKRGVIVGESTTFITRAPSIRNPGTYEAQRVHVPIDANIGIPCARSSTRLTNRLESSIELTTSATACAHRGRAEMRAGHWLIRAYPFRFTARSADIQPSASSMTR